MKNSVVYKSKLGAQDTCKSLGKLLLNSETEEIRQLFENSYDSLEVFWSYKREPLLNVSENG